MGDPRGDGKEARGGGADAHQRAGAAAPSKPKVCPPLPADRVELRTMPATPTMVFTDRLTSGAPVMKTFSAIGILKIATEQPTPKIGFVTPDVYTRIRGYRWNDFTADHELPFYTLLPNDEIPGDETPDDPTAAMTPKVVRWLNDWSLNLETAFIYSPPRVSESDYIDGNDRLAHLRRYILVVHADNPPANAYVAYFDRGEWFYIAGDDEISQKNFDLISLFMTMMAVPSTTPPVGTSISVGGGG